MQNISCVHARAFIFYSPYANEKWPKMPKCVCWRGWERGKGGEKFENLEICCGVGVGVGGKYVPNHTRPFNSSLSSTSESVQ